LKFSAGSVSALTLPPGATLGQASNAMRNANAKSIGWTFSVADFAKLGVRHIRVVNPPW
jgi:hypothetical protein